MEITELKQLMNEYGRKAKELEADRNVAMRPFNEREDALDALAEQIKKAFEETGEQRIEADEAYCILTGRGSYDWKQIALETRPSEELIEKHTKVDWIKVADETGRVTDGMKKKHYTEGVKHAELKVKKV